MQYNYSKKMFSGRDKLIRIIGESDNQRPDKWSCTVLHFEHALYRGADKSLARPGRKHATATKL